MFEVMALFIYTVVLFPSLLFGASYQLVEERKGNNFFDGFNFENHGGTFSDFIMSYSQASSMGLVNTTTDTAYIGTDYWNKVNSSGRPAIQIGSKSNYSQGLMIVDLSHMPYGCGVWPAWWLCGPDWPNNGEIDMIEGINLRTDDQTSLHTSNNCYFSSSEQKIAENNMTGSWGNPNCTYQPGCQIYPDNKATYGQEFNKNGGGVFAIQIEDSIGIKLWFWLHNDVPSDITNKKPDPSVWKNGYAYYPFGEWCTSNHFNEMRIIFDLYYCGWSGSDPSWKSSCQDNNGPAKGQDCETFVMNNPEYFKDAYWLINYLDIFQLK